MCGSLSSAKLFASGRAELLSAHQTFAGRAFGTFPIEALYHIFGSKTPPQRTRLVVISRDWFLRRNLGQSVELFVSL